MSRFFNLKGLPMSDDDMQSILAAVENAIPEMYDGKAYTLKDLVDIGHPGLWDKLSRYDARSAGVTFSKCVESGSVEGLVLKDKNQAPKKYIRYTDDL